MNVQMKKEIASGEIDTDGDDGENEEKPSPQKPEVNPIKPKEPDDNKKSAKEVSAERVANAPEERQG